MQPNCGIGANIALKDAAVFCREVIDCREDEHFSLEEAVGDYESKMFKIRFSGARSLDGEPSADGNSIGCG